QMGIVLQEPYLWNDTFANNIRYAKPEAGLEEVRRAATIAGINDFIESLPAGYDTNAGEMADKISEGQKQRVAIARAVIQRPAILILDEAMSSLDSDTEEKIIRNLRRGFSSALVIVVSHRLSTVRNMDEVYFLEAPDRVATGKHSELLENNPQYRKLFAGQIESESRV
ncbi:MAG: ATP-binding cassette domain-containing protein, partial [Candidatus Omnitrophota bacterium]